jgi:hypothetical protein
VLDVRVDARDGGDTEEEFSEENLEADEAQMTTDPVGDDGQEVAS